MLSAASDFFLWHQAYERHPRRLTLLQRFCSHYSGAMFLTLERASESPESLKPRCWAPPSESVMQEVWDQPRIRVSNTFSAATAAGRRTTP